jgi:hypothetical protein
MAYMIDVWKTVEHIRREALPDDFFWGDYAEQKPQ